MKDYKIPKGWLLEYYKFKNVTHYVSLVNIDSDLSVLAIGKTVSEAFDDAIKTALSKVEE